MTRSVSTGMWIPFRTGAHRRDPCSPSLTSAWRRPPPRYPVVGEAHRISLRGLVPFSRAARDRGTSTPRFSCQNDAATVYPVATSLFPPVKEQEGETLLLQLLEGLRRLAGGVVWHRHRGLLDGACGAKGAMDGRRPALRR